jgi:hypothetical protein
MDLIARPILDREAPRAARRHNPAVTQALVLATMADMERETSARRPPVVGASGNDWLEQARRDAIQCLPESLRNQVMGGCACDANGNPTKNACGATKGLRPVSIGAVNTVIAAAGSQTISLSPQAPFKPEMLSINGAQAPNVNSISAIMYGPTSMLIGGVLSGEMFSTLNEQGGYRLPYEGWLYPGQTISVTLSSIAGIAAGALVVMAYGFTTSPG